MATLLFLTPLLACTSELSQYDQIVDALKRDPSQAKAIAEQIDDPKERTIVITTIVETYPGRTNILCDALPNQASKERCIRINQRPHLWTEHRDILNITPSSVLSPIQEDCHLDPNINTCRTAQAINFIRAGEITAGLESCAALPETLWKSQCFFTIAEELSGKPEHYEHTINACDHTRQFVQFCWNHSVLRLASLSSQHWNDWEWHQQISEDISAVFTRRGTEVGRTLESHFWAQSIRSHIEEEKLQWDRLPVDLHPYARSAQAMMLLRKGDYPIGDMSSWLTLVSDNQGAHYKQRDTARGFDTEVDLWEMTTVPEDCRVISYLGHSKRLSCADERLDWELAFLEGSARLRPFDLSLIRARTHAQIPAIKKTVSRLGALDHPTHSN